LSQKVAANDTVTIRGTDESLLLANYRDATYGSTLIPSAGIGDYSAIQAYVATVIAPKATTTTASTTSSK